MAEPAFSEADYRKVWIFAGAIAAHYRQNGAVFAAAREIAAMVEHCLGPLTSTPAEAWEPENIDRVIAEYDLANKKGKR